MHRAEKKKLLKLISLKQEETLLKYLFKPFWKALTATLIFLGFCLVFNGSFSMVLIFLPIIAYGIYTSRKIHNRLIKIESLTK